MSRPTRAMVPGNGFSPRQTAGEVTALIDAEVLAFREPFEGSRSQDWTSRRGLNLSS